MIGRRFCSSFTLKIQRIQCKYSTSLLSTLDIRNPAENVEGSQNEMSVTESESTKQDPVQSEDANIGKNISISYVANS